MLRGIGKPVPSGFFYITSLLWLACALVGNVFLDIAQIHKQFLSPDASSPFLSLYLIVLGGGLLMCPLWFFYCLLGVARFQLGQNTRDESIRENGVVSLWNLFFAAFVTLCTVVSFLFSNVSQWNL